MNSNEQWNWLHHPTWWTNCLPLALFLPSAKFFPVLKPFFNKCPFQSKQTHLWLECNIEEKYAIHKVQTFTSRMFVEIDIKSSLHLSLTNQLPMLLLQSDVQSIYKTTNQCTLYDHILHKDVEQCKKVIATVSEIFIPFSVVGNNYLFHDQVKSGVKLFRLAFCYA